MWILDNCRAAGIQDGGHIALNIGGIIVIRAVVGNGHGRSGCVIGKVQGVTAHGHLAQTTAVIDIVISDRVVGSLGSQPVCIVGIDPSRAAIGHRYQLTAMLPSIRPRAVTERIADLVIGDGLAVISGQQVTPAGIAISIGDGIQHRTQRSDGVSVLLTTGNVACIVIIPNLGKL